MPHPPRPLAATRATCSTLALAALVVLSQAACQRKSALEDGLARLNAGDYPAATLQLKTALQKKPDSVEARLALVDALERQNLMADAEQHLRTAIESGGPRNTLVPRHAQMLLERNDTAQLLRLYQGQTLDAPEAQATLRGIVALALLAEQRLPQAKLALASASPVTPMVQVAAAQLELAEGHSGPAFAALAALQPQADTPWWVLRAMARVAGAQGQGPRALDLLQKAAAQAPWHAGVQGELGLGLLAAGQVKEAEAVHARLKASAPRELWFHFLDANLKARAGRTEESLAAAHRVLAMSPDHLPATLLAAAGELRRGEVETAARRLQQAVQKHPSSLQALDLLGRAQLAQRDPETAGATARRGLGLAPSDPRFKSMLVDVALLRKDTRSAATLLAELLKQQPEHVGHMLRLAELKTQLGERAEASALLQRAAQQGGDADPEAVDRVVAVALRTKDLALAQKLAESVVRQQPDNPRALLTLAAVKQAKPDLDGAWHTVLQALDKAPADPVALGTLRLLARSPEQQATLRTRYLAAVDNPAMAPQSHLELAALLRHAPEGRRTAQSVLEQGLNRAPTAVPLRAALVDEYLRSGDAEKGLQLAQSGASMQDAPPQALALEAATYTRLGRAQMAMETYRRLVAVDPQALDWKLQLAQLEAGAGRGAEALSLLRKAVAAHPRSAAAYTALAQYSARSNLDDGLSVARQMAAVEGLKPEGLMLEGDLLAAAGKKDEALAQFNLAAKAGARPAAEIRQTLLLLRSGPRPQGEQRLKELLLQYPQSPEVLDLAAREASASGRPADAVGWFKKLVALRPEDGVALNELAWAQLQAKQPEALASAQKAAALMPDSPTVLNTLGLAQSAAGQHEAAVRTLAEAAQLAPASWSAKLHLANASLAAGDRRGARKILDAMPADRLSPPEREELARLNSQLKG